MKKYIGVKMIEAEPMLKGESMGFEKWSPSIGQGITEKDFNQEGYRVIYPDGYKSWSPKAVFEEAYFPLEEGTKVLKEDVDLFMGDPTTFKIDEKTLLVSVKTKTGFVTHDAASCVDPKNFDKEIGTEVGMDNIRGKIWGHLGFVLQWAKFGLK